MGRSGQIAASPQSNTSVADKPHSPPASQGWFLHTEALMAEEALMARGADVNFMDVS